MAFFALFRDSIVARHFAVRVPVNIGRILRKFMEAVSIVLERQFECGVNMSNPIMVIYVDRVLAYCGVLQVDKEYVAFIPR